MPHVILAVHPFYSRVLRQLFCITMDYGQGKIPPSGFSSNLEQVPCMRIHTFCKREFALVEVAHRRNKAYHRNKNVETVLCLSMLLLEVWIDEKGAHPSYVTGLTVLQLQVKLA